MRTLSIPSKDSALIDNCLVNTKLNILKTPPSPHCHIQYQASTTLNFWEAHHIETGAWITSRKCEEVPFMTQYSCCRGAMWSLLEGTCSSPIHKEDSPCSSLYRKKKADCRGSGKQTKWLSSQAAGEWIKVRYAHITEEKSSVQMNELQDAQNVKQKQ